LRTFASKGEGFVRIDQGRAAEAEERHPPAQGKNCHWGTNWQWLGDCSKVSKISHIRQWHEDQRERFSFEGRSSAEPQKKKTRGVAHRMVNVPGANRDDRKGDLLAGRVAFSPARTVMTAAAGTGSDTSLQVLA
jgi:hypothetical protein